MGLLTLVSFIVLINGSPSGFFNASRGLEQGCSLSPFLLLLVLRGLSFLINDARSKGNMKGIWVDSFVLTTHILFVDDIMLFG